MELIILSKAVVITEVLDKDAQLICLSDTSEFKWMILMLSVKQYCRGIHPSSSTCISTKDCIMICWQSRVDESKSYSAILNGLEALHSTPFSRKSSTICAVRVDKCDNPGMLTVFHEDLSKVLMIKELGLVPFNTIKSSQICTW